MENRLNPHFIEKITACFPTGRAWLDRLPEHLDELKALWGLTLEEPYEGLSYHYVAPATLEDGTSVVLKTGPWHDEMSHQLIALRIFDGRGMCRLIRSNEELGAMLLERALPGATLWGRCTEESDAEVTLIAAQAMRKLLRPLEEAEGLPTLRKWMQGLERMVEAEHGIPPRLADMARSFAAELSDGPLALLHGDLHHGNILSHGDDWMAIDPKGVIGDPAFEPSAFLHNPYDSFFQFKNPKQALARRLDIFSEVLEIERERILKWAIAGCALSVWWGVEDEGEVWAEGVQCAEWLSELL